MAKKRGNRSNGESTATEAERAIEHNAKARKEVIRECAQQMREITNERKGLNERAGDIRERLRNCGIEVKSFQAALRVCDLEDQGERDGYISGLQEAFEALGVGAQLDMFVKDSLGGASAEQETASGTDGEDVRPRFMREAEPAGTA